MKNILIIAFQAYENILSYAHLIGSLKKAEPDCNIEIVVWSEFATATSLLKHLSVVHTISKRKIATIKGNRLFSPAMAFDHIGTVVERIQQTHWDLVINLDPQKLAIAFSALISNRKSLCGWTLNHDGNLLCSHQQLTYWQQYSGRNSLPHLNLIGIVHEVLNLPYYDNEIKVIICPETNQTIYTKFSQLRSTLKEQSAKNKLIGINLFSSPTSTPSLEQAQKIIAALINSKIYYPILITLHNFKDNELIDQLNLTFGNALTVIKCSLKSVGPVLLNLDALFTVDNAISRLAGLTKTTTLELIPANIPVDRFCHLEPNEDHFFVPTLSLVEQATHILDFVLGSAEKSPDFHAAYLNNILRVHAVDGVAFSLPVQRQKLDSQWIKSLTILTLFYEKRCSQLSKLLYESVAQMPRQALTEFLGFEKDALTITVKSIIAYSEKYPQQAQDTDAQPLANDLELILSPLDQSIVYALFLELKNSLAFNLAHEATIAIFKTKIKGLTRILSEITNKYLLVSNQRESEKIFHVNG